MQRHLAVATGQGPCPGTAAGRMAEQGEFEFGGNVQTPECPNPGPKSGRV